MKFYLVLLLILFSCTDNSSENDLGEIRKFEFIYEVHLSSSNEKVEVWIPIPQSNEVQKISNEKFDSGDLYCEKLSESVHGNYYYYCRSDDLENNITLSYTCHVKRYEHGKINYKNLYSETYGSGTHNIMVPEGDIFLDIISINNLSANNIKSVYDYVLNGMHYGKPKSKENQYYSDPWLREDGRYGMKQVSRDQVVSYYEKAESEGGNYTFGNGNSIYACDIGVGNCTDYHSYFISLLRTMGLSSRFHMGFSIPNDKSGKVGGYHCWADYYVEQEGWYPVDISEADKNPEKIDYFFGKICNNRVEFTTGRDLKLKNYNGDVNFFVYPLVEGTVHTKFFSYRNI